jgi:hypothetical protein
MVVGIVGVLFACLPMCGAPLCLIAIVLGLVGLAFYKAGRGMAIAGLVLGACGFVLTMVVMIVALTWTPPAPSPAPGSPSATSGKP